MKNDELNTEGSADKIAEDQMLDEIDAERNVVVGTPICPICGQYIHDDEDCIQVRSGGLESTTTSWDFIASQDEGYYHINCYTAPEDNRNCVVVSNEIFDHLMDLADFAIIGHDEQDEAPWGEDVKAYHEAEKLR